MRLRCLRLAPLLIALTTLTGLLAATSGVARASAPACAKLGCWTAPFSPFGAFDKGPPATPEESMKYTTAASIVFMPDGRIVYWNGLQNLENGNDAGAALDIGRVGRDSKTGVLDLTGSRPIFYYANSSAPGDDMFCADQRLLETGRLFVAGGTYWQTEVPLPTDPNTGPGGLGEEYGSPQTHLLSGFGTRSSDWKLGAQMHQARWYPTMLTLPNGNEFIAGGLKKLFWNSSILTTTDEMRGDKPYQQATGPLPENVAETEIYNTLQNKWTLNPPKDNIDLPTYARLHLLPDGQIFYPAVGQMWGPAGESINEADWATMKLIDPAKIGKPSDAGWKDIGMLPVGPMGAAFSVLMPFKPPYDTAQVLVGSGVIGTSPGAYLATNLSQLISLKKAAGTWQETSEMTGNMVNRRWFSTAALLPNGQVLAFNGADKDENFVPGTGKAVRQAELYDPATKTWTGLSGGIRDRMYHSTALLLPDGSVLIGGQAPINRYFGGKGSPNNETPLTSNNLKDPSFERFFPPYLSAGPRPSITSSQSHAVWGQNLTVQAGRGGAPIAKFVLSRVPAVTHTTDADQRQVELGSYSRHGNTITVGIPTNRALVPPGFYYLFAVSSKGVPSVATIVQVAPRALWDTRGEAKPLYLANQSLRAQTSAATAIEAPPTNAAKKAAQAKTAGEQPRAVTRGTIPLSTDPAEPSARPWLLLLALAMGITFATRRRLIRRARA